MQKRSLGDLAAQLSKKAAGDIAVLEKLLDDHDVPDEVLGFHAQQAVEKLIKAVLAHHSVPPPRTHDIPYLINLLDENGISAPPRSSELDALNPWATEFRYEDTLGKELERSSTLELVRAVGAWADQATNSA